MGKPSLRQQIRDLTEALVVKEVEIRTLREAFLAKERVLEDRILDAKNQVRDEQLMRVSAQRGLVAYMKEHGLESQIGYDPDKDVTLSVIWRGRS